VPCWCSLIGNDIIDLHFFETPLYRHVRYISRVCSEREIRALKYSQDATRDLAIIWAAKEATFKLFSKQLAIGHFIPREFSTNFSGFNSQANALNLEVSFAEAKARAQINVHSRWVHALAKSKANVILDWEVKEVSTLDALGLTPIEESKVARQLASELASDHGWHGLSIDSNGRIPSFGPTPYSDPAADVSLSHHGRFVAAAIAWPATENHFVGESSLGETCFISMA